MKLTVRIAGAIAALALCAATALAAPPEGDPGARGEPGRAHAHATPGPKASQKSKGRAYGRFCQDQSKKHVKGHKGTPFSQCVTAMAKLATGKAETARAACRGMSRKHVKGQRGTPFSRCVSGGKQLLAERA